MDMRTYMAALGGLGANLPSIPEPKQREPLQPTAQDFDDVAHLRHRIVHRGDTELTARWLAHSARGRMSHPGTPGSWAKRLRRLAALGWAKQDKHGFWTLTAEGKRASLP